MRQAIELGINILDVANVYSDGTLQETVSRAIGTFARRDKIVFAIGNFARRDKIVFASKYRGAEDADQRIVEELAAIAASRGSIDACFLT